MPTRRRKQKPRCNREQKEGKDCRADSAAAAAVTTAVRWPGNDGRVGVFSAER